MNVQRFIGKDNNDAMLKVKRELGSEAVILHTRKIKEKGIFGFFKKPLVEIVAAIEAKPDRYNKRRELSPNEAFLNQIQEVNAAKLAKENSKDKDISALSAKVDDLTALVESIITKAPDVNSSSNTKTPFYQNKFINHLMDQDVDEIILSQMEENMTRRVKVDFDDQAQVKRAISAYFKDVFGQPFIIDDAIESCKIFCFVGPTGVGKTTTIAKIAAKLSLGDNKRVALITADTYRIAAVEQLKTYSEILSIPLDVIYETDDIIDILAKHADKDYIFIDTAGRNHKDDAMHVDISELLSRIDNVHVFLVMSCTSSTKDVKRIIKSYDFIEDYNLIFTKIDEAESYGNLLNARILSDKKLAYVTNGQSVPDDINVADVEQIIPLLLGDSDE